MKALIDTGSDITIAGSRIAKKYRWKVRTAELKSVKTANNEPMIITGIANEPLMVGKKVIWSDIPEGDRLPEGVCLTGGSGPARVRGHVKSPV